MANDLKFSIVIDTKTGQASLQQLDTVLKNTSKTSNTTSKSVESGWVNAFAKINVLKDVFSGIKSAMGTMFGSSLEYEQSLKNVASLSDDVVNNYEVINSTLKKYSTQIPVKSTKELSDAMYQAVSAGFQWKDALMLVEQAGKGSVAGLSSVPESMNALISVMNAYRFTGEDTSMVMDRLFQTVRKGVTTFPELASSMSAVAPTAALVGIKFDDLMAGMVSLTKMKIPTSEAVTKIARVIPELTRNLGEGYVKTHSFQESLQTLYERAGGNLNRIKEMVGSKEAADAVVVIGKYAQQANQDLLDMQNSAGMAQKAFAINASSTANSMQLLSNNLKIIKSSLTSSLMPVIKSIVEGLTVFFKSLSNLPKPIQTILVSLVSLKGAFMLLNISGIAPLLAPLTKMSGDLLINLASRFKSIETVVMSSQKAFNVFSGVLSAGVLAAVTGLIYYMPQLNTHLAKLTGALTETDFERFSNNAKDALDSYKTFQDGAGKVVDRLVELSSETIKSQAEQKEYNGLINEAARIYPELVKGIDSEGNAIMDLNEVVSLNTSERTRMIQKVREQINELTYAFKAQMAIANGEFKIANSFSTTLNKLTSGLFGKSVIEQQAEAAVSMKKLLETRLDLFASELKLNQEEVNLFETMKGLSLEFGEALTMETRKKFTDLINSHNINIRLLKAQQSEVKQESGSLEEALNEVKRLQALWISAKTDKEALNQFNTGAKQFFTRYRRFKNDIAKQALAEGVDENFLKVLLRGLGIKDPSGTIGDAEKDTLTALKTLYDNQKISIEDYRERLKALLTEAINDKEYIALQNKFLTTGLDSKEIAKYADFSQSESNIKKAIEDLNKSEIEAWNDKAEKTKKIFDDENDRLIKHNERKLKIILDSASDLEDAFESGLLPYSKYVSGIEDIVKQLESRISMFPDLADAIKNRKPVNEILTEIYETQPELFTKGLDKTVEALQRYNKEISDLQSQNISTLSFWANQTSVLLTSISRGFGEALASGFSADGFKSMAQRVKEGFKIVLIAIADAIDKMYIGMSLYQLIEAFINPASLIVGAGKLLAMKVGIEAFKGIVNSFATGGLITQPTLALMGEAGTELVAPKQDFLTVARELIMQERKNIPQVVAQNNRVVFEVRNGAFKVAGRDLISQVEINQLYENKRYAY